MRKLGIVIGVLALVVAFAIPVSAKTYKLPKTVTNVWDGTKTSESFHYKSGKLVKFEGDALKYKGNTITVTFDKLKVMTISCKSRVTKVNYIATIEKVYYNKSGKIYKRVFTDKKGNKMSSKSYYYKNGKLSKICNRNKKGKITKTYKISYDTGAIIIDVGKETYVKRISYGNYKMTKAQYKKAKALTDWWVLTLF